MMVNCVIISKDLTLVKPENESKLVSKLMDFINVVDESEIALHYGEKYAKKKNLAVDMATLSHVVVAVIDKNEDAEGYTCHCYVNPSIVAFIRKKLARILSKDFTTPYEFIKSIEPDIEAGKWKHIKKVRKNKKNGGD